MRASCNCGKLLLKGLKVREVDEPDYPPVTTPFSPRRCYRRELRPGENADIVLDLAGYFAGDEPR